MCANAVWMQQEKKVQTCSWRPLSAMVPVETPLLLVLLSPCDLSIQTQPGPLSLLAQQPPEPSTQRREGLGRGQRKHCCYFRGPVSVLGFITAQSQLCTQGLGFSFLQHSLCLKTEMCACVHLLRGRKGWAFKCVWAPLHPWMADTALVALLDRPWAQAASPQDPDPSPSASKAKQHDKVRHGWFSIDSLASNFLQCTKTRQLSHCLCMEVSGALHTSGYSLSVCPHAHA